MNRRIAATIEAFAVLCLSVCYGCGSGRPNLALVSGKVTYQGKPVTEGKIVFHPQKGRQAIGVIDADGNYRLTTFDNGDGAAPGKYRVTIQAMRASGAPRAKNILDEVKSGIKEAASVEWIVPEKYSRLETSPLTAEVESEPNNIDFNVP
ncbi:MAG: carboxypeptidase regulatory-like domain-containing protein [Pirellulales bacterium]|nr:carboxypeptidase regulatory-like domain-containing protein [Pirellulales bacterium]